MGRLPGGQEEPSRPRPGGAGLRAQAGLSRHGKGPALQGDRLLGCNVPAGVGGARAGGWQRGAAEGRARVFGQSSPGALCQVSLQLQRSRLPMKSGDSSLVSLTRKESRGSGGSPNPPPQSLPPTAEPPPGKAPPSWTFQAQRENRRSHFKAWAVGNTWGESRPELGVEGLLWSGPTTGDPPPQGDQTAPLPRPCLRRWQSLLRPGCLCLRAEPRTIQGRGCHGDRQVTHGDVPMGLRPPPTPEPLWAKRAARRGRQAGSPGGRQSPPAAPGMTDSPAKASRQPDLPGRDEERAGTTTRAAPRKVTWAQAGEGSGAAWEEDKGVCLSVPPCRALPAARSEGSGQRAVAGRGN